MDGKNRPDVSGVVSVTGPGTGETTRNLYRSNKGKARHESGSVPMEDRKSRDGFLEEVSRMRGWLIGFDGGGET